MKVPGTTQLVHICRTKRAQTIACTMPSSLAGARSRQSGTCRSTQSNFVVSDVELVKVVYQLPERKTNRVIIITKLSGVRENLEYLYCG